MRGRPSKKAAGDAPAHNKDTKCSISCNEKVYLGVRVRMPVRDMLRTIRVSKGDQPPDQTGKGHKSSAGGQKRARTRHRNQAAKAQSQMRSLEELGIILEVLEEDLRAGNLQSYPTHPELSPACTAYSDDSDEMIPSPDYQRAWSPPDCMYSSFAPPAADIWQEALDGEGLDPYNQTLSGSAYFLAQLQREEEQLIGTCDADLLAADEHGRTALHEAVCVGKRVQGFAIAERMAALNRLDLKDSDGMTTLLYAAKHNQHLMVGDLIRLGANVNQTNRWGKSCLHLSAENGYIRVLEVLKKAMMDGVFMDMEATDNNGMGVLQLASLALKTSVCEAESKLHTLRQEQLMETLECLLQMESYLHTQSARGEPEYVAASWSSDRHVGPAGLFWNPTVMF